MNYLRRMLNTSHDSDSSLRAPLLSSSGDAEDSITPHMQDPDATPNIIVTSRYNIFTFLPKSLFEQFRRLANVYFLVLGIIAAVGANTTYYDTSVEPAGLLLPMTIVVLISIAKDGIEDLKRHRQDYHTNNRPSRIIDTEGIVRSSTWKKLTPGTLVLLTDNDQVPADLVLLAAGGIQGSSAYVETAAIDGETNLKIRLPCIVPPEGTSEKRAITISQDKTTVSRLDDYKLSFSVEPPNGSIHRFNGSATIIDTLADKRQEVSLSEKNLILRGSVIRATEWMIGIVVYSGADTKLSRNSQTPPSKMSVVDGVVNRTLIIAITAMVFVCVISAILSVAWEIEHEQSSYLCLDKDDMDDRYDHGGGCENASTSGGLTVFTFATLYNNFVCISMYVSLEMVYLLQAYFINQDLRLYDANTDTPAEARSSGMCADLGQVKYVLSDKTGTLTKNIMKLRRCSVAGMLYGAPMSIPGNRASRASLSQRPSTSLLSRQTHRQVSVESSYTFASGDAAAEPTSALEALQRFRNMKPDNSNDGSLLMDFIRNLAICNTVMLMPNTLTGELNVTDKHSLKEVLEAESADEVALVYAMAEHCEVLLTHRDTKTIVLRGLSNSDEVYDILAVNEFESNRKRMSILLYQRGEHCTAENRVSGRYILFCKGADSSTFSKCNKDRYTTQCMDHVDQFASSGLRTLVFARRCLSEEQANEYIAQYTTATTAIGDRTDALSELALNMEVDMELLGAVGIEDELQDRVSETIASLRSAGINIWMITGDKAETGVAIGRMAGLINDEMEMEYIVNLTGDELTQRVDDLLQYLNGPIASVAGSEPPSIYQPYYSNEPLAKKSILSIHSSSSDSSKQKRTIAPSTPPARVDCALVIDGTSLEEIHRQKPLLKKFVEAVRKVPTVLACRVSPLQKASLVRMVKSSEDKPVTVAVGDGANDIGMLLEAKLGIGISGSEGRHAANNSDFAISQFKHLAPLLLLHGRYNYIRCSKLVLYSFFKNLVLVSCLFYYCIYSGFSGTIPLDSIVLSGFNFYLGLPIIALGMMDVDASPKDIFRHPFLAYSTGRNGEMLNLNTMGRWVTMAFLQGLIIYAMVVRIVGGEKKNNEEGGPGAYTDVGGVGLNSDIGRATGLYGEGLLLFTTIIIAMQYKIVLMSFTINIIHVALWFLSFIGYFMFLFVYAEFPEVYDWYKVPTATFQLGNVWLTLLLVPLTISITDYCVEYVAALINPTSQDKFLQLIQDEKDGACSSPSTTTSGVSSWKHIWQKSSSPRPSGEGIDLASSDKSSKGIMASLCGQD